MKPKVKIELIYYCDTCRHIVCVPYSKTNLHKMAKKLKIKRYWFHKNHYDMPKRRIDEITSKCILVSSRDIVKIIKGEKEWQPQEKMLIAG